MVAVPAATPVTTPEDAFTVATPVALLDQVPPETVEENNTELALQISCWPLKVPAEGGIVTLTKVAGETVEQFKALLNTSLT
jgi:hypothetical protein